MRDVLLHAGFSPRRASAAAAGVPAREARAKGRNSKAGGRGGMSALSPARASRWSRAGGLCLFCYMVARWLTPLYAAAADAPLFLATSRELEEEKPADGEAAAAELEEEKPESEMTEEELEEKRVKK